MSDDYEVCWDGDCLTITWKGKLVFKAGYDHNPTISERKRLIAMAERLRELKKIT